MDPRERWSTASLRDGPVKPTTSRTGGAGNEWNDSSFHQPNSYDSSRSSGNRMSIGFVHAFSGATAGFASGVITCPLDVIKTKLQAQGGFAHGAFLDGGHISQSQSGRSKPVRNTNYKGLVGTARIIWREEGFIGFYRGLGPIILGYLPTWAVYFTVYESAKRFFRAEGVKTLGSLVRPISNPLLLLANTIYRPPESANPWIRHIFSAMVAGGCSTICTNPIWVIKTRLMSQAHQHSLTHRPPWHYKSTLDAAKTMYRVEGARAFYSGLSPALLGLSHVAVQFPLYEQFKHTFAESEAWNSKKGEFYNLTGILASSILSKICASSATYPHEVIRTRMQTQQRVNTQPANGSATREPFIPKYRGVIHAVRTVYLEEGWRAFYAGMGTNMVRAVPASAMTLLTYEFMVKEMGNFVDTENLSDSK